MVGLNYYIALYLHIFLGGYSENCQNYHTISYALFLDAFFRIDRCMMNGFFISNAFYFVLLTEIFFNKIFKKHVLIKFLVLFSFAVYQRSSAINYIIGEKNAYLALSHLNKLDNSLIPFLIGVFFSYFLFKDKTAKSFSLRKNYVLYNGMELDELHFLSIFLLSFVVLFAVACISPFELRRIYELYSLNYSFIYYSFSPIVISSLLCISTYTLMVAPPTATKFLKGKMWKLFGNLSFGAFVFHYIGIFPLFFSF